MNGKKSKIAESQAGYSIPLPDQKGFFKIPAKFGHVPEAEELLGNDKERRFEYHFLHTVQKGESLLLD